MTLCRPPRSISACTIKKKGRCIFGQSCKYRHDEQGENVVPADRKVRFASTLKYGSEAFRPDLTPQATEPTQYVKNSKGTQFPVINDPFKEARLGLAMAVKGMEQVVGN